MALTKCAIVFALFCNLASADWGPKNLVVEVDNKKGDFVDLHLQWESGKCFIASYHIFIESPGQNKTQEGVTSDLEFTIKDKELWTNYTVTVETYFCAVFTTLQANVPTPPGNPHMVKSISMEPTQFTAKAVVEEAFMPKIVDRYNVTYCSRLECKNEIIARNGLPKSSQITFVLNNLKPNTNYDITVVPEIWYQNKTFYGAARTTTFETKTLNVPTPHNFTSSFTYDEERVLSVTVSWEMEKSDYPLVYYNVTMECANHSEIAKTLIVKSPNALFVDMPNSANVTVQVVPFFNVSGTIYPAEETIFKFSTPEGAPKPPSNFEFVALSSTEIFAKWDPPKSMPSKDFRYTLTYTAPGKENKTLDVDHGAQVNLVNLTANTFYEVVIEALTNESHSELKTNFTTLAKDYTAPENITVKQTILNSSSVTYNLNWTLAASSVKVSTFKIEICDIDAKHCTVNQTQAEQFVSDFNYFSHYEIKLSAIYNLKLNQSATREASIQKLQTPGTKPVAVTKIAIESVKDTEAVLVWEAPANVPQQITKVYQVSDVENGISKQNKNETVKLDKLQPFFKYNVSVVTEVIYQNQSFNSNETFFQFFTDASFPDPVESVETTQVPHTNMVTTVWKKPKVARGKLDFYEVVAWDQSGKQIYNTTLQTSLNAVIVLPGVHNNADLTIGVRAANVNSLGQNLEGPFVNSTLAFRGVDAPTAEVVQRTSSSLFVKVAPSENSKDVKDVFFVLKNAKGENFTSDSSVIEVKNLSTYTNETVQVSACYSLHFCSDFINITALTNVGAPSPVTKLVANVDNRTSPFFNWSAPQVLNGPLDGYFVILRDLTNTSMTLNETLPKNQTSFVYSTEEEFEDYELTVMAFNYDLDNKTVAVYSLSAKVTQETSGWSIPKPRNTHETNKTSNSATIEWEVPESKDFNITCFHIEMKSLNFMNFSTEQNLSVTELKPWTNTTVLIRSCTAQDLKNCGNPRVFNIETLVDRPATPNEISFTKVSESGAEVHWKQPEPHNGPIDGFKIAVSEATNDNFTWIPVSKSDFTFELTNLTANMNYTARVVSYNLDVNGTELLSEVGLNSFTAVTPPGGLIALIIGGIIAVVLAAAIIAIVIYKWKKVPREDREQLVRA